MTKFETNRFLIFGFLLVGFPCMYDKRMKSVGKCHCSVGGEFKHEHLLSHKLVCLLRCLAFE